MVVPATGSGFAYAKWPNKKPNPQLDEDWSAMARLSLDLEFDFQSQPIKHAACPRCSIMDVMRGGQRPLVASKGQYS
jgi:hypothetical protein